MELQKDWEEEQGVNSVKTLYRQYTPATESDCKFILNVVKGALQETIHAHGAITKELTGSVLKRVYPRLTDKIKNNIKAAEYFPEF